MENNTPEQTAKDEDVMRRYERAEGIDPEDFAGTAEECRAKLRSLGSAR